MCSGNVLLPVSRPTTFRIFWKEIQGVIIGCSYTWVRVLSQVAEKWKLHAANLLFPHVCKVYFPSTLTSVVDSDTEVRFAVSGPRNKRPSNSIYAPGLCLLVVSCYQRRQFRSPSQCANTWRVSLVYFFHPLRSTLWQKTNRDASILDSRSGMDKLLRLGYTYLMSDSLALEMILDLAADLYLSEYKGEVKRTMFSQSLFHESTFSNSRELRSSFKKLSPENTLTTRSDIIKQLATLDPTL